MDVGRFSFAKRCDDTAPSWFGTPQPVALEFPERLSDGRLLAVVASQISCNFAVRGVTLGPVPHTIHVSDDVRVWWPLSPIG
jgi:hypothetical protein